MNEGKTNLFGYQGVCILFRFSREKQDGVMTSDLNNNLFVIFAQGPTGKAGNTLCYFVLNPIVFRCFKSPIDIQLYIYTCFEKHSNIGNKRCIYLVYILKFATFCDTGV